MKRVEILICIVYKFVKSIVGEWCDTMIIHRIFLKNYANKNINFHNYVINIHNFDLKLACDL